eukprot:572662-Amorphochlora_amoeboformis.AAC.1
MARDQRKSGCVNLHNSHRRKWTHHRHTATRGVQVLVYRRVRHPVRPRTVVVVGRVGGRKVDLAGSLLGLEVDFVYVSLFDIGCIGEGKKVRIPQ